MKTLALAFLALVSRAAIISLDSEPFYDFANGCNGLLQIPLVNDTYFPPLISKPVVYDGNVYVLSMLTHQVMELSTDEATGTRVCNVYGEIPLGPFGIDPRSFSLGLEVDPNGNFYISNSGYLAPDSTDHGSVWKLESAPTSLPVPATLVKRYTNPNGLPSGVRLDWRFNRILFSSEKEGVINQINLVDGSLSVWASGPLLEGTGRTPGVHPDADITNTNVLAISIGCAGLDISNDGGKVYAAVGDKGQVVAIEVDKNSGEAGAMAVVASSPEHTAEGVLISANQKTVYFTSVFANGTNLTPDSVDGEYQGGFLPGNAVWQADTATGESSRFYDEELGCVTGMVSARGAIPGGANAIFVANSGLDWFPGFPLGLIRNNIARVPYSSAFISSTGPAFNVPYNAKLLVLRIGN
jgi:hypothetical protein